MPGPRRLPSRDLQKHRPAWGLALGPGGPVLQTRAESRPEILVVGCPCGSGQANPISTGWGTTGASDDKTRKYSQTEGEPGHGSKTEINSQSVRWPRPAEVVPRASAQVSEHRVREEASHTRAGPASTTALGTNAGHVARGTAAFHFPCFGLA